MSLEEAVTSTRQLVPLEIPLLASGKVRDLYELSDSELLFVASDRISAYDVNLANGIPGKGRLLTKLTAHWIKLLTAADPQLKTHLLSQELPFASDELAPRSCTVRRLKIFPIEAIVRGYLAGSAWAEYQRSGTVHGRHLPPGLRESEEIPGGPIFTPSTKAPAGESDENISCEKAAELVGEQAVTKIEKAALAIYGAARDHARDRGIIIADTKFEFGYLEGEDDVILADEVLTPDSSRFWSRARYAVGRSQDSFDKQFLRDWLTKNGLKGKEDVEMPEDVVSETSKRYKEACDLLVGPASSS